MAAKGRVKQLTKEERAALKTFLSKSSVNSMCSGKPGKDYLDFSHRGRKALEKILHLFSREDQSALKDDFNHREEYCIGARLPNFFSRVAYTYRKNGIEPKEL